MYINEDVIESNPLWDNCVAMAMDQVYINGVQRHWTQSQFSQSVRQLMSVLRQELKKGDLCNNAGDEALSAVEEVLLWQSMQLLPPHLIVEYEHEQSPNRYLFNQGQFVDVSQLDEAVLFLANCSMEDLTCLDVISNNASCPLVNSKVIDILVTMCPNDFQIIPAYIQCRDGILYDYYLINILNTVDGLDKDKSNYLTIDMLPDTILAFESCVYKPRCLEEYGLARDADFPCHLLVNPKIQKAFAAHDILGYWMVGPHDYYQLMFPNH